MLVVLNIDLKTNTSIMSILSSPCLSLRKMLKVVREIKRVVKSGEKGNFKDKGYCGEETCSLLGRRLRARLSSN
ncbi:MAG: hypothetical protein QXD53_07920 [Candidatus Bathyarchaeia archaeon]